MTRANLPRHIPSLAGKNSDGRVQYSFPFRQTVSAVRTTAAALFAGLSRDSRPPVPLYLSATIALLWMAMVSGYLALHEMTPGHRGSYLFVGFYTSHLIFGCLIPIMYAFAVNVDSWWIRRVLVVLLTNFFVFYLYRIIASEWTAALKMTSGAAVTVSGYITLSATRPLMPITDTFVYRPIAIINNRLYRMRDNTSSIVSRFSPCLRYTAYTGRLIGSN